MFLQADRAARLGAARRTAERRQLISQLRTRASYIVPMNTIHHRLHCAMHTDARADYTFRIYVVHAVTATPHVSVRCEARRGGTARGARWLKSFAFHFAGLRARKVTRDLNDSAEVGFFTKNSEITRFNS
jgi:hypothetical protein